MPTLELQTRLNELCREAKRMVAFTDEVGRDFTAGEAQKYDGLIEEIDEVDAELQRVEPRYCGRGPRATFSGRSDSR